MAFSFGNSGNAGGAGGQSENELKTIQTEVLNRRASFLLSHVRSFTDVFVFYHDRVWDSYRLPAMPNSN
jgi:hypothetical protein